MPRRPPGVQREGDDDDAHAAGAPCSSGATMTSPHATGSRACHSARGLAQGANSDRAAFRPGGVRLRAHEAEADVSRAAARQPTRIGRVLKQNRSPWMTSSRRGCGLKLAAEMKGRASIREAPPGPGQSAVGWKPQMTSSWPDRPWRRTATTGTGRPSPVLCPGTGWGSTCHRSPPGCPGGLPGRRPRAADETRQPRGHGGRSADASAPRSLHGGRRRP